MSQLRDVFKLFDTSFERIVFFRFAFQGQSHKMTLFFLTHFILKLLLFIFLAFSMAFDEVSWKFSISSISDFAVFAYTTYMIIIAIWFIFIFTHILLF